MNNSSGSRNSCPPGQFYCTSGECIDNSKVCDRIYDCADRSDESSTCCKLNSNNNSYHYSDFVHFFF